MSNLENFSDATSEGSEVAELYLKSNAKKQLSNLNESKKAKELDNLRKIMAKALPASEHIASTSQDLSENRLTPNYTGAISSKVDPVVTMQRKTNQTSEAIVETANNEGEPISLNWSPTSVEALKALYPKGKAISDLHMVIGGAMVEPEVPFALIGPGDNRGAGYFVKSTLAGQLMIAPADKSPQVFSNPGLGPDGDADMDDLNPGASIVEPRRKISTCESKDPLSEENFVNPIDDSSELVIERLLTNLKDKSKVVPIEEVSKLFFSVQSRLEEAPTNNLQKISDRLSQLIAESLLINRNVTEQTLNVILQDYK